MTTVHHSAANRSERLVVPRAGAYGRLPYRCPVQRFLHEEQLWEGLAVLPLDSQM